MQGKNAYNNSLCNLSSTEIQILMILIIYSFSTVQEYILIHSGQSN